MSVVAVDGLVKEYGHHTVLGGVSFRLAWGDRAGLIGANGAGKTTLLAILAGRLAADGGQITRAAGARVGYLTQDPELPAGVGVRAAALAAGGDLLELERRLKALEVALEAPDASPELLTAYGELQARFEAAGGYQREHLAEATLMGLGLPPALWLLPTERLSGGQRVRLALARLLLQQPDLLLCDEPTNHLDAEAVEWLEQRLGGWEGALLCVSHDRYFLDRVCTRTLELQDGVLWAYTGGYSAYVRQRQERWAAAAEAHAKGEAEAARLQEYVERYRAGNRARQARSRERRLARLLREAPAPVPPPPSRGPALRFSARAHSGREVLAVEGLAKAYGQRVLFTPWDAVVERGERIGIVGPNGAGKTTLLRLLAGEEAPDAGGAYWGSGVEIGWLRQDLSGLDPEDTVLGHVLALAPDAGALDARRLLARFLFRGDSVFRRAGDLSGGERNRLLLCLLSLAEANVLLCDEPTNHLDIPAREALEEALLQFPGTLFLVSHDRYLLDRVATRIWWLQGGEVRDLPGGYAAYRALREAEAATPRARPAEAAGAAGPKTRRAPRPPADAAVASRAKEAAGLEAAIAEAEAALEDLGRRLADPGLYRDGRAAAEAVRAYEELKQQLEVLYARWEAVTP
jgi:ATP-binding cassette subfamily F protein 3